WHSPVGAAKTTGGARAAPASTFTWSSRSARRRSTRSWRGFEADPGSPDIGLKGARRWTAAQRSRMLARTELSARCAAMRFRWWLLLAGVGAQASPAQTPPTLAAAVQAYAEKAGVRQTVKVRHALVDLNGDGVVDALVFLTDPDWCAAAGCTLLVFRGSKSGYALVSDSRAVETPIRLTTERSQGWR